MFYSNFIILEMEDEAFETQMVEELYEEFSPRAHFISVASSEIQKIEDDLRSLDTGEIAIRNKQRKKRRLLAKKEKMKVRIQFAMRETESGMLSPYEKRTLTYYSRKFSPPEPLVDESDADFLYRILCTELNLTLEDWENY